MKQLSALGARRAFFRNPRRMRGMPDDAQDLMGQPGFNYFPGSYLMDGESKFDTLHKIGEIFAVFAVNVIFHEKVNFFFKSFLFVR